MTDAELMYASDEDVKFFLRVTEGLPKINGFSMDGLDSNRQPMAYGCGPHSVRCLREIVEITKPKVLFEIGFNCGYSAVMWLELGVQKVISCDISDRNETLQAADIIGDRYTDGRFSFFVEDSGQILSGRGNLNWLSKHTFDLIFIDGGHLEHHVVADIQLALALNIKYLAFDDWLEQFGPGVQPAIAQFPELKEVKIMGNVALFQNTLVS